jgi:hypothetical protein
LLRADTNAGFKHEKATDSFLCRPKRRVRVAKVRGIPEMDAGLVGYFDRDAKIAQRRLGERLSFCFRGLGEI